MRILLIFLLFIFSCRDYSKNNINKLIKSDKPDNLVKAFYLIGEEKDKTFISAILFNAYDARISHHYKFKGISVYQSKMIAMKKISGLLPPREITYKPDSTIVNYYKEWAKKSS